jgi:uncharacterized integral membrane protein
MNEEYWLEISVVREKWIFVFLFGGLLLLILLLLGIWMENLDLVDDVTGRDHLWSLGLDGRIILSLSFKRRLINAYTYLNYL